MKASGFSRILCALVIASPAIPAFMINSSGDRIAEEDKDGLGIYMTVLGNNGNKLGEEITGCGSNVSNRPGGAAADACEDSNVTWILVMGSKVAATTVSMLITWFDFIACLVFALYATVFYYRIQSVKEEADFHSVTANDYTVQVKDLPTSATEEEVREHFSKLYQLKEMDWHYDKCCRSKRPRPAPEVFTVEKPADVTGAGGAMNLKFDVSQTRLQRVQ